MIAIQNHIPFAKIISLSWCVCRLEGRFPFANKNGGYRGRVKPERYLNRKTEPESLFPGSDHGLPFSPFPSY